MRKTLAAKPHSTKLLPASRLRNKQRNEMEGLISWASSFLAPAPPDEKAAAAGVLQMAVRRKSPPMAVAAPPEPEPEPEPPAAVATEAPPPEEAAAATPAAAGATEAPPEEAAAPPSPPPPATKSPPRPKPPPPPPADPSGAEVVVAEESGLVYQPDFFGSYIRTANSNKKMVRKPYEGVKGQVGGDTFMMAHNRTANAESKNAKGGNTRTQFFGSGARAPKVDSQNFMIAEAKKAKVNHGAESKRTLSPGVLATELAGGQVHVPVDSFLNQHVKKMGAQTSPQLRVQQGGINRVPAGVVNRPKIENDAFAVRNAKEAKAASPTGGVGRESRQVPAATKAATHTGDSFMMAHMKKVSVFTPKASRGREANGANRGVMEVYL